MVEAPHPLKYIRRFVVLQEDIVAAQQARADAAADLHVTDRHSGSPQVSEAIARGPARPN
jgi:hypothetical protein